MDDTKGEHDELTVEDIRLKVGSLRDFCKREADKFLPGTEAHTAALAAYAVLDALFAAITAGDVKVFRKR